VADGHATNYLLPNGLAIPATETAIEDFKKKQLAVSELRAENESELKALAESLSGKTIKTSASANADGTLFGSVSESAILKLMVEAGYPVHESWISTSQPIKHTGNHPVTITLPNGKSVEVILVVEAK